MRRKAYRGRILILRKDGSVSVAAGVSAKLIRLTRAAYRGTCAAGEPGRYRGELQGKEVSSYS